MLKLLSAAIPVVSIGVYYVSHIEWLSEEFYLQAAEPKMKLDQVQVILRHGPRTPLSAFVVIPTIEQTVWDKDVMMQNLPCTDIPIIVKSFDGGNPPVSVVEKNYFKRGELPVRHLYFSYCVINFLYLMLYYFLLAIFNISFMGN